MVVPHCLMWCIWKERNSRCFEDIERSMPDIKLLFFRTLWTLFWIYLIFVMFVLDLFTPVYPLCTWVFFFIFLFINESLLLIKKKKKKNYNCFSDSYLLETTCVLRIYLQIHNCFLSFFQSFLYPCSIFIFFRKVGRGGGWG